MPKKTGLQPGQLDPKSRTLTIGQLCLPLYGKLDVYKGLFNVHKCTAEIYEYAGILKNTKDANCNWTPALHSSVFATHLYHDRQENVTAWYDYVPMTESLHLLWTII